MSEEEEEETEITLEEATELLKVSKVEQVLPNEKFGDVDEKEAIIKVNLVHVD